ncbi:MAG: AarF/ABC1/UbiB kinase family protein [Thermorudis peleae]|nr:AarF/ABC1/UbiB kinase family protein [Thermorudis peleae]
MSVRQLLFPTDPRMRRRLRQIAAVISHHGLGLLAEQLGLSPLLGRRSTTRQRPLDVPTTAQHLRQALEELGPTFIKLGQLLSTREDLLPTPYITELALLRDRLPPIPTDQIVATIERSLGRPLTQLFAHFDPTPLASASLGQVHAARLPSQLPVAVKVQKPGIREQIEEDLKLLTTLARIAQRYAPLAAAYDLPALAEEFARAIRMELDYRHEGKNAETFRNFFRHSPDLVVPTVYWDYTTEQVLTLERIHGIPIDDIAALDTAGIDRHALAQRAARIVLTAILQHGFFHADPHPGNFAVLKDGRIVAYDFGLVGHLTPEMRDTLLDGLVGAVRGDLDLVIDALQRLGILHHSVDRGALRRDLAYLLDRYAGLPIGSYQIQHIIADAFTIMRRHHLVLPSELALLLKTIATHEAVARHIDPSFTPLPVAEPIVRQLLVERYRPEYWFPRIGTMVNDTIRLMRDFPRRLDRLLWQFEHADLEVTMHIAEYPRLVHDLRIMINRLIVALLITAGTVAFGLLVAAARPAWLSQALTWILITLGFFLLVAALALTHERRHRR